MGEKVKEKVWEAQLLFKVEAPTHNEAAQWVRDFVKEHLDGKGIGLSITKDPIEE